MYNEMVRNVQNLKDFYGVRYNTGTQPDLLGQEWWSVDHTQCFTCALVNPQALERTWAIFTPVVESLCSSATIPTLIDFGIYGGSNYLRGSKTKDFVDSDWLNASYLFYDENAQLVCVKVADTLDNQKMGYEFQKADSPWLKNRPVARAKKSKIATTTAASTVFFR